MGSSDERLETYGTDVGRQKSTNTRLLEWVLVDGGRLVLTLIACGLFLFALLLFDRLEWIGFQNDDSMTRLAGGMMAGLFSLVTITVSINQLITSRVFGSAGELTERLDGIMEFRRNVESVTGDPSSPAEPTMFFRILVQSIADRADGLAETAHEQESGDLAAIVERYGNTVSADLNEVDEILADADFTSVKTISTVIDYNDAWAIYAVRRIRNERRDDLSPETVNALDEMLEALQLYSIAKSHFKTTYMQRELARFSRLILFVGTLGLCTVLVLGLVYAGPTGAMLPEPYLGTVVPILLTIVFSPLFLLVMYASRAATIARRTASIGPIIPTKDPQEDPLDVPESG